MNIDGHSVQQTKVLTMARRAWIVSLAVTGLLVCQAALVTAAEKDAQFRPWRRNLLQTGDQVVQVTLVEGPTGQYDYIIGRTQQALWDLNQFSPLVSPSLKDNTVLSLSVLEDDAAADIVCLSTAYTDNKVEVEDVLSAIITPAKSVMRTVLAQNFPTATQIFFADSDSVKCAVWGMNTNGATAVIRRERATVNSTVVDSEAKALESIYNKCCATGRCLTWESLLSDLVDEGESVFSNMCGKGPYSQQQGTYMSPGGVCDGEGHIVSLEMVGWGLDCEFPLEEFSQFTRLNRLALGTNSLRGDINDIVPALTAGFPLLRDLGLGNNGISGTMTNETEISLCQVAGSQGYFEVLDLHNNALQGTIPRCLLESGTLIVLNLGHNNFTGSIPDAIPEGSNLRVLSLDDNWLSGPLPPSVANASSLVYLDVENNMLTGALIPAVALPNTVQVINVGYNKLSGDLPATLVDHPSLQALSIRDNQFTAFPQRWSDPGGCNTSAFDHLDAAYNLFMGPIPSGIIYSSGLLTLYLQGNEFSGTIPTDILGYSQFPLEALRVVDLSFNQLTGPIPEALNQSRVFFLPLVYVATGNLVSRYLDLSNNQFTGTIPPFVADTYVPGISTVELSGNSFACPLPNRANRFANLTCVEASTGVRYAFADSALLLPYEEALARNPAMTLSTAEAQSGIVCPPSTKEIIEQGGGVNNVAVAGIALGCFLAGVIITVLIMCCCFRRRRSAATNGDFNGPKGAIALPGMGGSRSGSARYETFEEP